MRNSIPAWSVRCDFFITAWVMPMIEVVIPAILCNNLHWSSCCNVWNVEWAGSISDSMGVGEYHGSCLLRLSWLVGRTDFRRMNTLRTINSLGRREWSRECSGCCSSENHSGDFPYECLREILMAKTHILILAWVRIWPLHMLPPLPLSPGSEGKSGAERVCSSSKSWGVACNL